MKNYKFYFTLNNMHAQFEISGFIFIVIHKKSMILPIVPSLSWPISATAKLANERPVTAAVAAQSKKLR